MSLAAPWPALTNWALEWTLLFLGCLSLALPNFPNFSQFLTSFRSAVSDEVYRYLRIFQARRLAGVQCAMSLCSLIPLFLTRGLFVAIMPESPGGARQRGITSSGEHRLSGVDLSYFSHCHAISGSRASGA
ncbi:hypothetical protein OE88DRAFT_1154644 [Heliocybe sulcata]|uniref:Uncharacterized protein n=1 Tax=Heliocybe sulcata TaxID=5364 RepID=A0A5C3N8W3_9AGAM|nr:hypothetical protein OE88DRAFT_1154644 [Heliocybe sulcata]